MSAADHLGLYADGWTRGDAATVAKAVTDDYTFDDPSAGVITKAKLGEYVAGLKDLVRSHSNGKLPDPFMELTEVVTQESDGVLTAWCWWAIPGTDLKGSGLIKVGAEGVRSEVITFYAKPAG